MKSENEEYLPLVLGEMVTCPKCGESVVVDETNTEYFDSCVCLSAKKSDNTGNHQVIERHFYTNCPDCGPFVLILPTEDESKKWLYTSDRYVLCEAGLNSVKLT